MTTVQFNVPTYRVGNLNPGDEKPISVHDEGAGRIRVVLGRETSMNLRGDDPSPDIMFERRPGGWVIVIHPTGDDAEMTLAITDNGVLCARMESGGEVFNVATGEDFPGLDQ